MQAMGGRRIRSKKTNSDEKTLAVYERTHCRILYSYIIGLTTLFRVSITIYIFMFSYYKSVLRSQEIMLNTNSQIIKQAKNPLLGVENFDIQIPMRRIWY